MPSYAPRDEPIKKQEELLQRVQELQHAIRNNFLNEKLAKAVKKYRTATLSFFKAKIHSAKQKDFQGRPHSIRIDSVEKSIVEWNNKSDEEIITEFKSTHLSQ